MTPEETVSGADSGDDTRSSNVELIDPDDPRYSHVVVTEVTDANAPSWSRMRAIMTGMAIGALFGVVFFAGYGATSAWICSSRLDCGHWAPITMVSVGGALTFTLMGAVTGYLLHKMYRLFKVA